MNTLDVLQARSEIANLIARYMRGIDDQDVALYSTCLTDDVVVSHPAVGRFEGRAAAIDAVRRVIGTLAASQHLVGNLAIEVESPRQAQACFEIQAMHLFHADVPTGRLRPAGARYEMRLRCVSGAWRVASAIVTPRWLDPGFMDAAAQALAAGPA
ncbi:MAG: nuclear transport factor 2 family protein [Gammaproteobacteria bacterium]|nr:nuclear transport factor 2 family protein [Gammaproteobacteria bacterium]